MSRLTAIVMVVLVGVLASFAFGQDSVSKTGMQGLPGDALSPWVPGHVNNSYVVDMVPLTGSWETEFAVAPLVKNNNVDSSKFNNFGSAQCISRLQQLNVSYKSQQYDLWVKTGGYGVHPSQNLAPSAVTPAGTSNQFAVAWAEWGDTAQSESFSGIIGAVVNYDPAFTDRLYVKRVNAAVNGLDPSEDRSQLGIGSVDEAGNVFFRADSWGSPGPNPIQGNNILAVRIANRANVVNYIDNAGGVDKTYWLVQNAGTKHHTPNMGPAAIFGGIPKYLGSNFDSEFGYSQMLNVSYTKNHLPPTVLDQRGQVAYVTRNHPFVGGTHGTCANLGMTAADPDTINVWGLDSTGNVAPSPLALTLPGSPITDPVTGVETFPSIKFDHFQSQTYYRGGNSQVALNFDQQDRLLAAAVAYTGTGGTTDPYNDLIAARVDSQGVVDWVLVSYSSDQDYAFESGKEIWAYNASHPQGLVIGRQVTMEEATQGSTYGPSMSAPMIDAAGNIWFIGTVRLDYYKDGQQRSQPEYDSVLLRAVYDPGILGYTLELVLEPGEVFNSENSGKDWTIEFLELTDHNSVSSGTAFSGNISEKAYKGLDTGAYPGLQPADAECLGGLVINARMHYDVDGDGEFNSPTSAGYDPQIPADESYQTLLYVAPRGEPRSAVAPLVEPVSPPVVIPQGGSFNYRIALSNDSSQPKTGDAWIMLNAPGLGLKGPVLKADNFTVPGNGTVGPVIRSQSLPATAPLGLYQLIIYWGDRQTNTILAADEFEFIVQ